MGKSDDKTQVLGDDPLAWLSAGSDTDKKKSNKASKKKAAPKKKVSKKKVKLKKENKVKKPKVDSGKTSNRLMLESSLVINKASDIHEALKKLSANGQAVEIDASKVENIDSAILQLLVAYVLDLKKNDIELSWYKPTEALKNKSSILGLTERLGL